MPRPPTPYRQLPYLWIPYLPASVPSGLASRDKSNCPVPNVPGGKKKLLRSRSCQLVLSTRIGLGLPGFMSLICQTVLLSSSRLALQGQPPTYRLECSLGLSQTPPRQLASTYLHPAEEQA